MENVKCKMMAWTVGLALAAVAAPTVTVTDVAFDAESRKLTVDYTLSAPAVVTVEILTNGIPIGAENHAFLFGDVNRFVDKANGTIFWKPEREWRAELSGATVSARLTAWDRDDPPDYMVFDLSMTNKVYYYASAGAVPFGVTNRIYKTDLLVMRRIRASGAEFRMGGNASAAWLSDPDNWLYQSVPHLVTLTNDFYMGIYEFTQGQYMRLMKTNTSPTSNMADVPFAERMTYPLDKVSYDSFRGYTGNASYDWPTAGHTVNSSLPLGQLRTRTGVDTFDYATDAQWEFACRAGTSSEVNTGVNLTNKIADVRMDEVAWYKSNSVNEHTGELGTHEVGLKRPNAWGLYDMHGNVWEYVLDYFSGNTSTVLYYSDGSPVIAPVGASKEDARASGYAGYRTKRGGAYDQEARHCTSHRRNNVGPAGVASYNGHRVIFNLPYTIQ